LLEADGPPLTTTGAEDVETTVPLAEELLIAATELALKGSLLLVVYVIDALLDKAVCDRFVVTGAVLKMMEDEDDSGIVGIR